MSFYDGIGIQVVKARMIFVHTIQIITCCGHSDKLTRAEYGTAVGGVGSLSYIRA